jgi:hypothetical protein
MEALKLFRADGTYDQIGQLNRILAKANDKTMSSFDLSKATDRFPINVQTQVLAVLTNSHIANAWKALIIGLPFRYNHKDYY